MSSSSELKRRSSSKEKSSISFNNNSCAAVLYFSGKYIGRWREPGMNGTSVSNGTRLSPIGISQRSFGNFPESLGKWKTPPVYGLVSNGSFLLRLIWNDEFAILRKVFRRFLNRKFEDHFQGFFRLGHIYFDLFVFRMSDYAWKTNFWCHIMIDRLTTNQIVVLLPVRGRTEFGKKINV